LKPAQVEVKGKKVELKSPRPLVKIIFYWCDLSFTREQNTFEFLEYFEKKIIIFFKYPLECHLYTRDISPIFILKLENVF